MQAVKLNEQQKVDANERAWTLDWYINHNIGIQKAKL